MKDHHVSGYPILSLIGIVDKSDHTQILIPFDGIAIWHRKWYRPNNIEAMTEDNPSFSINENDMCRAYILLRKEQ